ncbi:MAG: esterase family protein [Thermomicrobia bacterium]|nr:esterase family protein [Thermomicrobia bacterium]MCA1725284.1 esterase family protein [Thermomicrobia bacterium]
MAAAIEHRMRQVWARLSPERRRRITRAIGQVALRRAQLAVMMRGTLKGRTMPAPHTIHERTFISATLGQTMPYTILLPAGYDAAGETRYPVLYLLHGAWSNHTEWATRTKLADHAARFPLVVVCPEGENSCYVNGANGERWEEYIVAELPAQIEATERTRAERSGRAIAGLSMGGLGAFACGMRHPDRYCAIASHSGAFDLSLWDDTGSDPQFRAALGPPNSPARQEYDPQWIIEQAVRAHGADGLPMLAMDCGRDDYPALLASNRALHRTMTRLGVHHFYREQPGGHDWMYWDREVRFTLQFVATAMGIAPIP